MKDVRNITTDNLTKDNNRFGLLSELVYEYVKFTRNNLHIDFNANLIHIRFNDIFFDYMHSKYAFNRDDLNREGKEFEFDSL